ncbi:MAG: hypothetical protein P8M50_03900 [Paracoccaceae bacterium]|nr:hypothetical protein [Paracoccaceae bacterium]
MAVKLGKTSFERLSFERLNKWKEIPTAIIGDSLNRQNVMANRIAPVGFGSMAGQAQTVSVIAGDNGAIHAVMDMVSSTDILVIDGGGYLERALWGGILNARAIKSGLGGVIIDGAVRDILELKGMPLPVYAAGITPAGPHKGWGGQIGGPVSCGGVSVAPGDIVVGDADGVVVIPFKQESKTYDTSLERIAFEEQLLRKIDLGEDLSEVFKKPKIELL